MAPDGNGVLQVTGDVSLNNSGQVAFKSNLIGTSGGQTDNEALYLGDGNGELVQLIRTGDSVTDGLGQFSSLGNPYLNDAGQAIFRGGLVDTVNLGDNSGLFRSDATGSLVEIVREGDAVPDGNGQFADLGVNASFNFDGGNGVINEMGQVAFTANLKLTIGGDSDNEGLYLYDDTAGVLQIARTGEPFLDSTITGLAFLDGTGGFGEDLGNERSGFNDAGQVAYLFVLADGREGIAVATLVPEPSSLLLTALGLIAIAARRKR